MNKKNVKRGNIVAFSGVHLEIVTKVYTKENWFSADEKVFCSRGGGRASSEWARKNAEQHGLKQIEELMMMICTSLQFKTS